MKQFDDNYFEIGVVDPEYGRGEDGGVDRSSFVIQKNGTKKYVKDGRYKKKSWDDKPADAEYFKELIRVTQHQVIWGCNYYNDNFGPGRLVWDKVNDGSDQSDCEIAYNSQGSRVDLFRYMWRGMMQGSSSNGAIQQGNKRLNEERIHPTQKPIQLYKWTFQKTCRPGFKILDTHVGSGSSRIAAYELGLDFYGCEKDEDYYNDQEARFLKYIEPKTKQPELFTL
jgi:site-specific DNA-methyltransferase (adenine-specific)